MTIPTLLNNQLKHVNQIPLGVALTAIDQNDLDTTYHLAIEEGRFIEEPLPKIVFFGIPTLKCVTHEFMHYLVYCTEKEKR